MKRFGALLASLAFVLGCPAAEKHTFGTVSGTVTVTGAADNSNVLVTLSGKVASTAAAGAFSFTSVTPGENKVSVAREGYVSQEKSVTVVAGQDAKADFTLVRLNRAPIVASVTANPPTVARKGKTTLSATATDLDGDTVTYTWTLPAGWSFDTGSAATMSQVTVVAPDVPGVTATLNVDVADGKGGSGTASVVVSTQANGGPIISSVTALPPSVAKGGTIALAVAAQDPEGDALQYAWSVPSGWTLGADAGATASVTAPPDAGVVATVSVVVKDSTNASATGSVVVSTLSNSSPVISSVTASPSSVAKGGSIALAVSAQDADGDTLTYLWTVPSGWTLGANGSAAATVTAPMTAAQVGVISVRVTDSNGAFVNGSVSVSTLANNAPAISSVTASPASVAKGGTMALAVTAQDVDGDALSYQWTVPSGWTLSADAGVTATLTAPATPGQTGIVSIRVTDTSGAQANGTVAVSTLANTSPAISGFSSTTTSPLPGQVVTVVTSASDADGDMLTYSYVSSNLAWVVTGTTSQVTVTAPQTNASSTTLTVTVTDSVGATTTAQLAFSASSCATDTMNCDGNPANGCEASLGADTSCGTCATSCGMGTHCNRSGDGATSVCRAPAISCSAIQTASLSIGDGTYWVKPTNASVDYPVWCDMTTAGGGWTTFFAKLNGSVNNDSALTIDGVTNPLAACSDPKSNCVRRVPASAGLSTEVLATCGNAKASFRSMPVIRNYLVNGAQASWVPTADVGVVAGSVNVAHLANMWTGNSVTSRGWILSTRPENPLTTFAGTYATDANWNYCNGTFDVTSPVRLMYRNKMVGFIVQAPKVQAGSAAFNVTVTAVDTFGQPVPEYRGTVTFSSTLGGATLPANYTFVEGDNGRRSFAVTLSTAGATTLTVTDAAVASLNGSVAVTVSGALGSQAVPALSCEEIFQANTSSPSGIYWLRPVGVAQAFQAACDMTSNGGGWTVFYSALNGPQNVINYFELTAEDCSDPEYRCMRRVPASMAISSEVMASCGKDAVAFTLSPAVRNYFASGSQGAWQPLYNQATAAASGNPNLAQSLWTGSGTNRGWIMGSSLNTSLVMAAPYAGNYDWARCNGATSYTSPIRLMYRQRVTGYRVDLERTVAPATARTFQVVAVDKYNHPVTDYRGTVRFSTTGVTGVTVPADYTFTAGDNGAHVFTGGLTIPTVGSARLTVVDTAVPALTSVSEIEATTTLLGSAANPASSCNAIKTATPTSTDGLYWLTDGMTPYQVHCDMTTAGGGWTLAMKADGRLSTFVYSASYWTAANTLSPGALAEDRTEAKYVSFNTLAGTQLLAKVESGIPSPVRTQVFALPATQTLLATFQGGYSPTSLTRAGWKTLFGPYTSLQVNCNREGFNITGFGQSVRLGLVTNENNDCTSPDSRVGIGGEGANCSTINLLSVGNTGRCASDFGDRDAPAFAWLYVR